MHSFDMNSRDLLASLMSRAGDTANSLARKVKVPQPTIYRFLSGTAAEPRASTLEPIARHYGVPVEAFLSDRARAAIVATLFNSNADQADRQALLSHPLGGDIAIPQFDTGGKMGNGFELRDQPGVIQSWRVSSEWIEKNVRGYSSKKNLCIVTGFGDSMQPMYNPGDPLLVDAGVHAVDFDAVYFFRIDNEGFIKRLQRIPGQGVIAMSENKSYRDWTIDSTMDFEVLGRVLKVWCSKDF